MGRSRHTVGLISDTHGLLRSSALRALNGVERIIHAGDIDKPAVLEQLNEVAPVIAVRGNMDRSAALKDLPLYDVIEIRKELFACIIHDLAELDFDPAAAGFAVVVSGHTHKPLVEEKDGVLYVNPGSAGPRRFSLPASVGILEVNGAGVESRIIELGES